MILPILLGVSGTAVLVDLHVDASAPCLGADGSATAPFCSIDEALNVAVDGDVIRIAAGTYQESLDIARSLSLVGEDGSAVTILDGGGTSTIVRVSAGKVVSLEGLTLRNGGASGAVNHGDLTLRNCTVSDCRTAPVPYGIYGSGGGAIFHDTATGGLTLTNCTMSGNSVPPGNGYYGGGVYAFNAGPILVEDCTFEGNRSDYGAAIFALGTDTTIRSSTFSDNVSAYYGAVYSGNSAAFEMVNSTVVDNDGGGVWIGAGPAALRSVTITRNDGMGWGAGLMAWSTGTVTVSNSVIAANVNCYYDSDVVGGLVSGGHNFIGSMDAYYASGFVDGVQGDRVGVPGAPLDPQLGPLADNGGATLTCRPVPTSPLVDAGDQVQFEPTDQRGVPRTAGQVTIGSTEESFGGPVPGCVAAPNSTGATSTIDAFGSGVAAQNDFTLTVTGLPPQQFGIFIASLTPGYVPQPGGSAGNLCLSGLIGRFRESQQILSSGSAGAFALPIPLDRVPQGSGTVSVLGGETWYFQAWHRDVAGGAATSNFSPGLVVTFL